MKTYKKIVVGYILVLFVFGGIMFVTVCIRESKDNKWNQEKSENEWNYTDIIKDVTFNTLKKNSDNDMEKRMANHWYLVSDSKAINNVKCSVKEVENQTFCAIELNPEDVMKTSVGLQYMIPNLKGDTYRLEFDAMSNGRCKINVGIKMEDNDGSKSYEQFEEYELTNDLQKYCYVFSISKDIFTAGTLHFDLNSDLENVYIGNIHLTSICN